MDGEGMNSWANLVAVTFSGVISTNISVSVWRHFLYWCSFVSI